MDKSHAEDAKTVHRMVKIKGIEDAIETHVPYKGKEYCLAAFSHSAKKEHSRIISSLLKDKNIKSIKKLSEEATPF